VVYFSLSSPVHSIQTNSNSSESRAVWSLEKISFGRQMPVDEAQPFLRPFARATSQG
jgi:hypothetical protein